MSGYNKNQIVSLLKLWPLSEPYRQLIVKDLDTCDYLVGDEVTLPMKFGSLSYQE